jgi:hypothetical protein
MQLLFQSPDDRLKRRIIHIVICGFAPRPYPPGKGITRVVARMIALKEQNRRHKKTFCGIRHDLNQSFQHHFTNLERFARVLSSPRRLACVGVPFPLILSGCHCCSPLVERRDPRCISLVSLWKGRGVTFGRHGSRSLLKSTIHHRFESKSTFLVSERKSNNLAP